MDTKFSPLVVGGAILVAAAIGIGVYLYFSRRKSKNTFTQVDTVPKEKKKQHAHAGPTLVLFYADWCPHCQQMTGDWAQVEKTLAGKINTKAIESKNPELRNFQFQGFPTIRLYPHGNLGSSDFIDYTGPRDASNILNFAYNNAHEPPATRNDQE